MPDRLTLCLYIKMCVTITASRKVCAGDFIPVASLGDKIWCFHVKSNIIHPKHQRQMQTWNYLSYDLKGLEKPDVHMTVITGKDVPSSISTH